jgi:septum site-determining protein MinC
MDSKIIVKGIDDKLVIKTPVLGPDILFESIRDYIQENSSFLQGAKVVLDLGENQVKSADLYEIKNIFLDNQIMIHRIQTEDIQTKNASEALGIATGIDRKQTQIAEKEAILKLISEDCVYINRTVRSGNVVNSTGHLAILGDVNPGAIVVAVGDIIIWGKLKGEAQAGINGDKARIICALEMTPAKLKIADISWQGNRKIKSKQAEFAHITDGEIKIISWK